MSPVHVYFFPVQFVDQQTLTWVPMCSCNNLHTQGIALSHLLMSAFAAVECRSSRASWLRSHFSGQVRLCAHVLAALAYVGHEISNISSYPVIQSLFLESRKFWPQIPVLQYHTTSTGVTRLFSVLDSDNSRCLVKCSGRFMSCRDRLGEHQCSSKSVCRHRHAVMDVLGEDVSEQSAECNEDTDADESRDDDVVTEQDVLLALMDATNVVYRSFRTLPLTLSWDPRPDLITTVEQIRTAMHDFSASTLRTRSFCL